MISIFLLVCLVASAFCQRVESVQNPNAGNGCNVVNVHFGDGENADTRGSPGPPGKRGVVGPVGLKGSKGEIGNKGDRGPMPDGHALQTSILEALSSRSCADLRTNHGISKTGYYLLSAKGLSTKEPVYRYCDFNVYQRVSTCAELANTYNISRYGYYRFGSSNTVDLDFHYCPDVYTCHHLVQRDGIKESGFYRLGSPGGYFQAFCNFFSGQAITEIWHDSMHEIKAGVCYTRACYARIPQYNVDANNIIKITQQSKFCRQFIKYRCQGSVLLYSPNAAYGYWISRDGEKMQYWGDAPSKTPGHCACGETGSCINKNQKCNCDNNANIMTQDEGYLYDKSKLPVKEMRFGDLDGNSEHGWHTLGKLECSGEAD